MSLIGTTPLINAIKTGKTSYAIFLIQKRKVDVNEPDKTKKTPLIHAVLQGNKSIIELLLDKGADVNKIDKSSRSAIDYAVSGRDHEITSIILARISETANKQLRSRRRSVSTRKSREKSYELPSMPKDRQVPNTPSQKPTSRKTRGGKKSKRKTSKK